MRDSSQLPIDQKITALAAACSALVFVTRLGVICLHPEPSNPLDSDWLFRTCVFGLLPQAIDKGLKYLFYLLRSEEEQLADQRLQELERSILQQERAVEFSLSVARIRVLFNTNRLAKLHESDASIRPPTELCCPISRNIMDFPIKLEDGKYYDKKSIVAWATRSNRCPLKPDLSMRENPLDYIVDAEKVQEIELWLSDKEQEIHAKNESQDCSSSATICKS